MSSSTVDMMIKNITILIPCLNEEKTIGSCVQKALKALDASGREGEVVVIDNGSTDNSPAIAKELGTRIVKQPVRGYGAAYLKGIEVARGECIIMGDGDDTYDFRELPKLLDGIDKGCDMVLGSRFKGKINRNAMSFTHRYIGNPVLTFILNMLFHCRLSDTHSGFRAITRTALDKMQLRTTGMEFASEMIISALKNHLKIAEVPIDYYPRLGESKLHSLSDAWRHLRFMLLFSPDWLFLVPGTIFFLGGFLSLIFSLLRKLVLFGHIFDLHAMIFFVAFTLLGFNIIMVWLFAKSFSVREGFVAGDPRFRKFIHSFTLETGLIWGGCTFLAGFAGSVYIAWKWITISHFGELDEVKVALLCFLFMIMGIQIMFSSFFLSLLGINRKTLS